MRNELRFLSVNIDLCQHGTTLVIRPRFMASEFWIDIRRYDCSGGFYHAEMFRYVLAQPEVRSDP